MWICRFREDRAGSSSGLESGEIDLRIPLWVAKWKLEFRFSPQLRPSINRRTRCKRSRQRLPLPPEPRHERQRPHRPGHTASGGGEPRQLSARTVGGARRSGADSTQTRLLGLVADGLAASVRYRRAVGFERIGVRQPGGLKAGRRVRVTCHLNARQGATNQNRSRVVAQILGFVGPLGDESTET